MSYPTNPSHGTDSRYDPSRGYEWVSCKWHECAILRSFFVYCGKWYVYAIGMYLTRGHAWCIL